MSNRYLPLARFKVLDLTQARSGPTAVRQLADWGAEVVKIELPASMGADVMGGRRHGFDFQNLHRNKKSLTLNLKSEKGREIFFELAKWADVIVENYRPRVKERLGIGYEAVRRVNPGIVYGSISDFGQAGPYAERPGLDQIAQGMSGLMSVTGAPGGGLMRAGVMGISLGGYYAPRNASMEKRFKACVGWGAEPDYHERWKRRIEAAYKSALSVPPHHILWILNAKTVEEALEKLEDFRLDGVVQKMRCPYLLVHGEDDQQVSLEAARALFRLVGSKDKTLRVFRNEEGGAQHCQMDNVPSPCPTCATGWRRSWAPSSVSKRVSSSK